MNTKSADPRVPKFPRVLQQILLNELGLVVTPNCLLPQKFLSVSRTKSQLCFSVRKVLQQQNIK